MLHYLFKQIKSRISELHAAGHDLSFLNFLYDFSWLILKRSNSQEIRLWDRNSYHFKSYIPGLSDIDISVLSADYPDALIDTHHFLKFFFPWLGEINWYPKDIAVDMLVLANRVEIKRDPHLCTNLGAKDLHVDHIHKFIFLLRMLDYDLAGLQANPVSRRRKWAYHWDLVAPKNTTKSEFVDKLSVEEVIWLMLEFVPDARKTEIEDVLRFVFIEKGRCDWLMPHKYLNLFDFSVTDCESVFPELTQAQIDWEFWGICTQAYWLPKESFQDHLHKLNKLTWDALPAARRASRENILRFVDALEAR